jgi:hypothetical protein
LGGGATGDNVIDLLSAGDDPEAVAIKRTQK